MRLGDVLTIVRAQEGTSARTILTGDQIANTVTAKVIEDLEAAVTAGGITAIGVSAGTLSAEQTGLTFDNSNGVSFGLETNGVVTGTVRTNYQSSGDYLTIASAAGDYTAPEGPILGASGDLTIAAFGATVHWLKLNVKAVHDVRIKAAGTSSTITGHFGLN